LIGPRFSISNASCALDVPQAPFRPALSHYYGPIRQLVAVHHGIVSRNQQAGSLNAVDHRIRRGALAEQPLHAVTNVAPFLGADPPVETTIGDDLDVVVGPQDVDQHAIV